MDTLIKLFLFCFLLSSCMSDLDNVLKEGRNKSFNSQSSLSIENELFFVDSNGTRKTLALAADDVPILVLFASRGCISCGEEHRNIQTAIETGEIEVGKDFHLYSYMVGVDDDDDGMFAIDMFMYETHMSWPLGLDSDSTKILKFCKKNETPCTVFFHPKTREMVYTSNGTKSIQELLTIAKGIK